MATANGTLLRLYVQGSIINCEVTSTFESSFGTDKTACKDNPEGSVTPGPIDFSATFEALIELSPSGKGIKDIAGLHINKTTFAFTWTSTESGGISISGSGYISSFSATAGTEEAATFSGTITGSGAWSYS